MKKIYLIMMLLTITSFSIAQDVIKVIGKVVSKDGKNLSKATISIVNLQTKDSTKITTDDEGSFKVSLFNQSYNFLITYIGYDFILKKIDLTAQVGEFNMGNVEMNPGSNLMSNITLESQKVQIKEDTVAYLVDSTMYRKNDNVEALLKNMPGIQVDKDGTVTAQGKQVTRVKVNGKDFFNGDVTTATRELNADMVEKIQIIDDYGDQAAFTGIKDGDPTKTMNIQLRKDKNKGYFGSIEGGYGTASRYLGKLSINKFNNNQQISVFGNMNNTNASLFNFGNGGGGGAVGNMMGGMARSMGIGRGGAGAASVMGNFGNNDGLNTVKSIGINYRDKWGSKMDVYGSYSVSDKSSSIIQNSTQQSLFQNKTSLYIQNADNYNIAINHRASFNVEYKIDSMNYIKFNPSFSYSENDANNVTDFITKIDSVKNTSGLNRNITRSKSPNFSSSLLFNHRFKKRGRTMSINLSQGKSGTDSDDDFDNLTKIFAPFGSFEDTLFQNVLQDNKNKNFGTRISYTEPLSKKRNLEFNYSYNNQFIGNDRKNYNINPSNGVAEYVDTSSNIFNNEYITHRIGINLKTTEKKYNYSVGFSAQPAKITTNSITADTSFNNNLVNFYPVIRFAYNFSKSRSLNINYNGSTNQPSNTQLQPIEDKSNPQFITIGNPDLRPEFTNTFSMRYNNFNFISGNVFFGNITASFTQDKIVNSTRLLRGAAQETKYKNANGFYNILGFYNVSKPIKNRKYVFNLGGNILYNNNISYLRDTGKLELKNTGKNWVLGQRFSTDIKIKKWLETNISLNYSLNSTKYSVQSELNSNTIAWTLSHNSRIFLPKDFILSYDVDKYINLGFANNATSNPLIINATIEKQLLTKKNLIFKIQAFDMLNQNVGINRNVSGTGFTDSRTNRLGRYFIFSFVCKLNKFSGEMQSGNQMQMRGEGGGMRMGF